ncbi:hypothetical protein AAKU67_001622 [Oxalobacteraceae bacterium GrIS 2.11]
MLNIVLPDTLESAITEAAHRSGLSINEYITVVCEEALSLEIDRIRVNSYLEGTPAISHEKADAWLTDLASGKRTECPR